MSPFAGVPEDVNVFEIPHSRMKELVNDYFEMLQTTNFSSTVDLNLLLESLDRTFCEFRCHEMIENKFIMKKLKSKLKKLSIQNTAVCNCHKDSRLKAILSMVRDGFKKKTQQDRVNYGLQLKKELQDFTETFLPHMAEEEEVFQPMLQQYFSVEELRELRERVIQQHLAQHQLQEHLESILENTKEHTSSSDSDEEETLRQLVEHSILASAAEQQQKLEVSDLPPELLIKVFSYVSPLDLGRCAQVSKQWSQLAVDPQLWQVFNPVQWAQGDWSFTRSQCGVDEEEEGDSLDEDEDASYAIIDEDADVDETQEPESDDYCDSLHQAWKEARVLTGLTKYILPKVGHGVQKVILANSKSLTTGLLRKILVCCPQVEHLDLSQTRVSDEGLKCIGKNSCCNQLKHLSLSGCVNVSDTTLVRLAMAIRRSCCTNDNLAYNNDEAVSENIQVAPPAQARLDCLCDEYYQACGQKLDSACSAENSVECCGKNLEGCCVKNPEGCIENERTFNDAPGKYEGAYDEDKDIDEVAMVTNKAESESADDRTFEQCHSCCAHTPDPTWAPIEDCYVIQEVTPKKCLWQSLEGATGLLQYLNLSGCFQVTDLGVRALARCAQFPDLQHLDLSGCLKVTGPGMSELVASCPNLEHRHLFYCDNVVDGPFADTASGCRNLQSRNRVCCRTGR